MTCFNGIGTVMSLELSGERFKFPPPTSVIPKWFLFFLGLLFCHKGGPGTRVGRGKVG